MAIVASPFDQNLLERLNLRLKRKRFAWFALNDKEEEGQLRWNKHVRPLFLNWGSADYGSNTERADCVGVANDHTWYFAKCYRRFKAICQKGY